MDSYGPPHMTEQKQDDQLQHTYSNYKKIRDVALKTCHRRWTIGRSGERGSGISLLAARHDDDDNQMINVQPRISLGEWKACDFEIIPARRPNIALTNTKYEKFQSCWFWRSSWLQKKKSNKTKTKTKSETLPENWKKQQNM